VAVMRYVCGGMEEEEGKGGGGREGEREGGRMIAEHFREVMELLRVPWAEEEARKEEEEEEVEEEEGRKEGGRQGGRMGRGIRGA